METITTTKGTRVRRRQVMGLMAAAIATVGLGWSAATQASSYPTGPLTMVIPFAPGGSTDIIGRLLADRLATALGQPVVVENRAGAGGNIGASMVARARPNGHTMLFGTTGILSMNEFLYNDPGYRVGQDLVPVVYTASISNVLIVNNDLPVKSAEDLLKLVKENPGRYTFASSGAGSSTHMSGELFKSMGGVELIHVPYRGSGQALIDLMAARST